MSEPSRRAEIPDSECMHALRTNLGVSLGVACIASLSGVRGAYKGDTRILSS